MKKIAAAALALLTLAPMGALAAPGAPARGVKSDRSLKWLPKARQEAAKGFVNIGLPGAKPLAKEALANTLEVGDDVGYLDAPDGSTWYYSVNYDYETIEHEAWTEQEIKGYHYRIYDKDFNLVAEINDEVRLAEGETGVADVQIGPAVSKKFFNYDDKYEFMIVLMLHTDQFVNNIYTLVYSQGVAEPINRLDGYYISAINTSTESWSEDMYMTFITEEETEQPEIGGVMNVADNVYTIYRKAGYAGMDVIGTLRVPMILMSGEDALPFLAKVEDGKPLFALNHLKYCFYEDPYDWENENATPDNELIIKLYSYDTWEGLSEVATTTIATETAEGVPFSYYYLGNFTYEDDITFGLYTDSADEPAYIITRSNYLSASDDYCHDYLVYNVKGEQLLTIAEGVTTSVFQSDVEGCDPQVMFVRGEDGNYTFEFVNMLTGEVEHVLPYYIGEGITINTTCDRVPAGVGNYLYVVSQLFADEDEQGNVIHTIGYVTPEGEVDHADRLNIGKKVALAQCYIAADALNPYIFNTDSKREYMVLVKRLESTSGSRSHEELLVLNTDDTLLQFGPDAEKGDLQNIWLSVPENGDRPFLSIIYNNEYRYTMQNIALPLEGITNGSGTAEDPYIINTIGDLEQIASNLSAHYRLGSDIHADGYRMRTISGDFTGVLDGNGHYIDGLLLSGSGIFESVMRQDVGASSPATTGIVRNLTLLHPTLTAGSNDAGIIATSAMGGTFSNIRIYDAKITGSDSSNRIGGIAATAVLGSVFEGCLVQAEVESHAWFGGIVSDIRTGSTVKACKFMGDVKSAYIAGGIVGYSTSADNAVRDCHVVADITADNNIGGIVSYSGRSMIENCCFEGSLTAVKPEEIHGEYYCEAPVVGGVVGNLEGDYSESEEPTVCVRNNIVNINSMSGFEPIGPPRNPNVFASMHRIVGFTVFNDEADDNGQAPVENGLSENYCVSTFPAVDKNVEEKANTTEGGTLHLGDLTAAFLAEHGFRFGTDIDNPWKEVVTPGSLELWFEDPVLVSYAESYNVKADETVTTQFELFADNIISLFNSFEDTTVTFADEGIAELVDMSSFGDILNVTVKGLKPGATMMNVAVMPWITAQCQIIVEPTTGIETPAVSTESLISCDGTRVLAADSDIRIYNAAGVCVAAGRNEVSLAKLPGGVYIATATAANGLSHSLKLRLR